MTFAELTRKEQAQSITAMLNNVRNAIRRHILEAADPDAARAKCRRQAESFAARVRQL